MDSILFYPFHLLPSPPPHTHTRTHAPTPPLNLHSRRIQPYFRGRQGQGSLFPAVGIYVVSLFNLIALKTSGGRRAFSEWRVPGTHPSRVYTHATHTHVMQCAHMHRQHKGWCKQRAGMRTVYVKVQTCGLRLDTHLSLAHRHIFTHIYQDHIQTYLPTCLISSPFLTPLSISYSLTNTLTHTRTHAHTLAHSLPCRATRQLSSICQCYS